MRQGFLRRIYGILLRHYYLNAHSFPRLIYTFFWPVMLVLWWGYIAQYLQNQAGAASQILHLLLGAFLLWQVFWRGAMGISTVYMEEYRARALANLFLTPMTNRNFIASMIVTGTCQSLAGISVGLIVAYFLFDFHFVLGVSLAIIWAGLAMVGWSLGLVATALVIAFGHAAQNFNRYFSFALGVFSAVYYPIDVLPASWQALSHALPLVYFFEAFRKAESLGIFPGEDLLKGSLLGIFYAGLGLWFMIHQLKQARIKGKLTHAAE